ncbi:BON domain-containing protein [Denitromonas ohlonensis]|jgi:hyperosmotically inducible protein|uniref:BON domain-containing protein n=2 Tax=Denitromonas TaxID=139331 RepID=A0A557SJT2_9RHOO|nr:BON domain-containing protein [Denitromonas ohlonensis]TVT48473.1 MAG: BON domain-containing protein [Denitromonas halophila]TVO69452.1 BON domain-containing protein [Denitromonas ohlonensis]TVO77552.1 BON domain-containing protein [Denitromonas ohlonensis]TVT73054.1 MAG: BON domain-containing protein [Denitromonas halophila]TVT74108.1 MAG: BON domain-containing protein [Denitromonas halophila]
MKHGFTTASLIAIAALSFGIVQPGHAADAPAGAAKPVLSVSAADAAIKGKVEAALAETTTLQDAKIRVDVSDGVILLSGQVSSPAQRDAAAQRAAGVAGVKRVINELAPPTGS